MKKLLALAIAFVLILSLAACGGSGETKKDDSKAQSSAVESSKQDAESSVVESSNQDAESSLTESSKSVEADSIEPISLEDFKSIAGESNLTVEDISSSYNNSLLEYAYTAEYFEGTKAKWAVDYMKLKTVDEAKRLFTNNKETIEGKAQADAEVSEGAEDNYELLEAVDSLRYQYVCRIDDTIVFCSSSANYSEDIVSFITSIGYY